MIRGRWSDSLAQWPDGWIACGNLHQSRAQLRGRCVVQYGRNERNRSIGDAVGEKAAGQEIKPQPNETADEARGDLVIDAGSFAAGWWGVINWRRILFSTFVMLTGI